MSPFLGIDGGGTKTAFVLIDAEGSVLARSRQPSSDYYRLGVEAVTRTLADGVETAGRHEVRWAPAAGGSGVYHYRLSAGGRVTSRLLTATR